jgi:hypothetical protein
MNGTAVEGSMIDEKFASDFVARWKEAWNSHDLDRFVVLFSDDFRQSSPNIGVEANGVTSGLKPFREHCERMLARFPSVSFEPLNTSWGVSSLIIVYRVDGGRSATGRVAAEVFFFNDDAKVCRCDFHWAT